MRIVFAGGGTLGHVIPALPVARELKKRMPPPKLFFIGTKSGLEKERIKICRLFDEIHLLDAAGFQKNAFRNLLALFKFARNYHHCRKLLKKIRPAIVVGMGGYASAPAVLAASRLKIKTAIHEQNASYGLANKFLKKRVDRILLAYDIDRGKKTRLVGNPRTSEIYRKYKNKPSSEDFLLIVGGSRGAKRINDLALGLKEEFIKRGIKVVLITGSAYYRKNHKNFKETNDFVVKDFVEDLPELMHAARAVVSRSGATTLAEIMALRKPSLLIPSPNVAGNHQEKNALEIAKKEGALMIRESELTPDNFLSAALSLMVDRELRKKIITNLNWIADLDACNKFTKELDEMMVSG